MKRSLMLAALALLAFPALAADDPFAKKPADWTLDDVKAVLNKENAWVKTSDALSRDLTTPDEKSQKNTSNDREKVFIRWSSSGIIRQAGVRAAKLSGGLTDQQAAEKTKPIDRFYILSVSSVTNLSVGDTVAFDDLEKNVGLESDDGSKFALINVVRPKQSGGPEISFFFDRGNGIPDSAKKATFHWQLGDTKIEAVFELSKMVVEGKRDLDGDTAPLTAEEKRRRAIQAAALADADLLLKRAVENLTLNSKSPNPQRPWAVGILYNAKRSSGPGEDVTQLALAHKQALAAGIGKWSAANKNSVYAVFFADATGKVVDYVSGADAEALAKKQGEAAKKFFESKLTKPKEKS